MGTDIYGASVIYVGTIPESGILKLTRDGNVIYEKEVTKGYSYYIHVPPYPATAHAFGNYALNLYNSAGQSIANSGWFTLSFGERKNIYLDYYHAMNQSTFKLGDDLRYDGANITHSNKTIVEQTVGGADTIPVITVDKKGHITNLSSKAVGISTTSSITNSSSVPTASAVKNYVDGKIITSMPSSPSDNNILTAKAVKNYVSGLAASSVSQTGTKFPTEKAVYDAIAAAKPSTTTTVTSGSSALPTSNAVYNKIRSAIEDLIYIMELMQKEYKVTVTLESGVNYKNVDFNMGSSIYSRIAVASTWCENTSVSVAGAYVKSEDVISIRVHRLPGAGTGAITFNVYAYVLEADLIG